MSIFFRLNDAHDKGAALKTLCASALPDDKVVFVRSVDELICIPGAPLAYWASTDLVRIFGRLLSFEKSGRFAGQGVATADNFRFLRLYWETSVGDRDKWFGLAKGGAARSFYGDVYLCIKWATDGAEFKAWAETLYDNSHWSRITMNYPRYGLAGLTWSRRATDFAVRALPPHCVFGDKGPAIFTPTQTPASLLATSAVLNSLAFKRLLELQLARLDLAKSYETGAVSRTPVPELSSEVESRLARLAHQAWSLSRSRDQTNETSHAFLLPPTLLERLNGLDFPGNEQQLLNIQHEIDDAVCELYGLEKASIQAGNALSGDGGEVDENHESTDEDDVSPSTIDSQSGAFGSWLIGVAFGRFDPRLATVERPLPPDPEPFDPLPPRSPGMWPEGEEPARHPDILVDDEGHADDLVAIIHGISERVQVDTQEKLRTWLAKDFFPLHIKMYSKSRRKAPIYWQIATPSASYSVWLYIHAFTKDTLFRVQNGYAAPKLAHEERRLESLIRELGADGTAAQRKELAAQETFVEELRSFLEEVKRVAPLWNPNLDDGVIINFAPLWRLVPQHKAWQKELKATWDSLCAGNYDWSHLAMHLWPERVVPKCAADRSLAIAHGLKEIFWVEGDDGKWKPRKAPTRPVSELVSERSSPAVKAALKSLMEAPEPAGQTKRGRKTKSA